MLNFFRRTKSKDITVSLSTEENEKNRLKSKPENNSVKNKSKSQGVAVPSGGLSREFAEQCANASTNVTLASKEPRGISNGPNGSNPYVVNISELVPLSPNSSTNPFKDIMPPMGWRGKNKSKSKNKNKKTNDAAHVPKNDASSAIKTEPKTSQPTMGNTPPQIPSKTDSQTSLNSTLTTSDKQESNNQNCRPATIITSESPQLTNHETFVPVSKIPTPTSRKKLPIGNVEIGEKAEMPEPRPIKPPRGEKTCSISSTSPPSLHVSPQTHQIEDKPLPNPDKTETKHDVNNATNTSATPSNEQPTAPTNEPTLKTNDTAPNKIETPQEKAQDVDVNPVNETSVETMNSTSKSPKCLRKSVSNEANTPPLVCSIAIPVPAKILKSDKIPVMSVIGRTLSHEKKTTNDVTASEPKMQQVQRKISTNEEKKNLVQQESKFQSQLAELSKQLSLRDAEALKLRMEMEELQRDVIVKAAGMDRLQAELLAANKESEHVRKKLRNLEEDLTSFRQKNAELSEDLEKKSVETSEAQKLNAQQAAELESKIASLMERILSLEAQLETIKIERDKLEESRAKLEKEREEEKKLIQETLEMAMEEKKSIQQRWERDFEKLRTVNTDREQQLLDDFEWKLREVEQTCKRRLEEKDKKTEEKIQEAFKIVEEKTKHAEEQLNEVLHLKSYEAEVKQLRGLTDDQQRSLRHMSERTIELQLAEENLKEEVTKLQTEINEQKAKLEALKIQHEKDLIENERVLQIRLEEQKGEVAVQWEERLRQECGRLKFELDQMHNEEKTFAIEAVKQKKEVEFLQAKEKWERQVEEQQKEIATLKQTITAKEENHHKEMERLQTNADRDILELRRSLDKLDMSYNDRIEKMIEKHELEIETLNEDNEKRVRELENNWQMQITSTRTTLELVKEQMTKDHHNKIQELDQHHRNQLERQWEQLVQDKEEALQIMEQKYRSNCDKLKDDIVKMQKIHAEKETELQNSIENLRKQLMAKNSQLNSLQSNVDTLQGGIQVLNKEIKDHGQEMMKVRNSADKKIRSIRENLLCEQTKLLAKQKEMHVLELQQVTSNANQCIEQLQKKCQCLTKLFEDVRSRYECRESRQEDLNLIADLRQIISEQEKDLALLTEEKRFYQLELSQANFRRKGGGRVVLMHSPSPEFENARSRSHSPQSSPELKIDLQIPQTNNHNHRGLEVIWETPDCPEEVFHVPRSKSIDMPTNGHLNSAFQETASSI